MSTIIRIILGSVRAGRQCPIVGEWVAEVGRETTGFDCTLLDLKDRHLPMDDEPNIPSQGHGYEQPHTKTWSEEVMGTDAFVIVTPQYNGGIPAPLKNAMDHLCPEWEGKPVINVTYGIQGGTKCAEQLRQLTIGLKMRPTDFTPALSLPKPVIEEGARLKPHTDFASSVDTMRRAFVELGMLMRGPAD